MGGGTGVFGFGLPPPFSACRCWRSCRCGILSALPISDCWCQVLFLACCLMLLTSCVVQPFGHCVHQLICLRLAAIPHACACCQRRIELLCKRLQFYVLHKVLPACLPAAPGIPPGTPPSARCSRRAASTSPASTLVGAGPTDRCSRLLELGFKAGLPIATPCQQPHPSSAPGSHGGSAAAPETASVQPSPNALIAAHSPPPASPPAGSFLTEVHAAVACGM